MIILEILILWLSFELVLGHTELPKSASLSTAIASNQLDQLSGFALNVTKSILRNTKGTCTLDNLQVRRDWRAFSAVEKKAYIKSVLCLQALPARTPSYLAAGAKTRYDDFVATHIKQTLLIHRTGTFLGFHRWFIHEFESALRSECAYTGDYPYWDWGADTDDMENSEVFDGSETSLSGNGAWMPTEMDIKVPVGNYTPAYLPTGSGGGCVTSGPFVDYVVNMGPSFLSTPGGNVTGMANALDYNPRCMTRDLTSEVLQRFNNYTSIVHVILNNHNVWDFQTELQGWPGSGSLGLHGGGHYSMGGDPGRDADGSPGEPGFWHHHGMIDRVWWIWQSLDLKTRQYAISGTGTFMNEPASPNTTLETMLNIGYANSGPMAMKNVMSTTAGPFCYIYV
ncbi:unnamed protein product [Penicillium salamii]|uniref:Tyrosinase copper-binding domain-containing protein n=1 Tax=Penicillium salamii TaxID=1612424 RepID=A0A9W4J8D8_9EURO|nr:unnamed protein product [Penicillium salamii]CAG8365786.1 unnamed protein product [Penicillium salamii]CAG8375606.1 unnamed protein product [Penicillium salamii]CAG8379157.1 unnamed protein product [Penicillium salamii]